MTIVEDEGQLGRLLGAGMLLAGAASAALGFVVLFGWYTENVTLVQVHPAFVPMQYNTALGFLLCGVGLLATVYGRARIGLGCGAAVGAIGLLTLIEYIFGVNLGIDQLLMEHYITVQTSHPGRMAPNTALCFALSGATLLVAGWPRDMARRGSATALLASIILGLGTIAFFGYLSGLETAYGWGHLTRMAIHTAAGFMVIGIGLLLHAVAMDARGPRRLPRWLPMPVGIALVTISISIWQAMDNQERRTIHGAIQVAAQSIADEVEVLVEPDILALKRMADRWIARGGTPRTEWEADAKRYVEDRPGIQAIEWVDPSFHVRWIVPLQGNEQAQDLNLGFEKQRRLALEAARERRDITISRTLTLVQGGTGFLVYVPIYVGERFDGFILGVYRVDPLLNSVIHHVSPNFALQIFDGEREIFRRFDNAATFDDRWGIDATIELRDTKWRLRVIPRSKFLARSQSSIPEISLGVGILGAVVLALTLYLALEARIRARETESARRGLEIAIELRKQFEKDLKASENRFREFSEVASDWFWETDADGRYVFVSDNWEIITGVSREDTLGSMRRQVIEQTLLNDDTELKTKWQSHFELWDRHEEFRDHEYPWRHASGAIRYLSVSAVPIFHEAGAFAGYRGTGRDITRLKEHEIALQQSEQRFSKAFHLSPNLTTIIDAKTGAYTDVNAAWFNHFGYDADEIIGRTPREIGTWVDTRDNDEFFTDLREHGSIRDREIEAVTKTGQKLYLKSSGETVDIDDRPHWLLVGEDITERKRADDQIRQQSAQLEDTNRDLARRNEELDDFAYTVSHDLKQSLRGISNYATFVIDDYGDRLDDKGREMLATLPRLAVRLGSLTDDLLHLSRVGRADFGIKETDLNVVVDDVVSSLQTLLQEQAAEIRIPRALPTVSCDSVRVTEVFRNFITNAAKYNDKDERLIEIGYETNDAGATKANNASVDTDGLVFYVKDNGIGIPKKHQETIFRIFKRLHGRDKFGGGTGAGMTIVKRIVERHGGRIWLDSEPGVGSTFYFTLSGGQPQRVTP